MSRQHRMLRPSKVCTPQNVEHGIKAVVTVARGAFLNHDEAFLPNYLYIPAEDIPEFQLAPYFGKSYDFIDRNLLRTNVSTAVI